MSTISSEQLDQQAMVGTGLSRASVVALVSAALGALLTIAFIPVALSGFIGIFLFQIPLIVGIIWICFAPVASIVAIASGAFGFAQASNTRSKVTAGIAFLTGGLLLIVVVVCIIGYFALAAYKNS